MQEELSIPDPSAVPLVSIERAGEIIGISRDAAYKSANAGILPTIQIGPNRRKVPVAELRRWLKIDQ